MTYPELCPGIPAKKVPPFLQCLKVPMLFVAVAWHGFYLPWHRQRCCNDWGMFGNTIGASVSSMASGIASSWNFLCKNSKWAYLPSVYLSVTYSMIDPVSPQTTTRWFANPDIKFYTSYQRWKWTFGTFRSTHGTCDCSACSDGITSHADNFSDNSSISSQHHSEKGWSILPASNVVWFFRKVISRTSRRPCHLDVSVLQWRCRSLKLTCEVWSGKENGRWCCIPFVKSGCLFNSDLLYLLVTSPTSVYRWYRANGALEHILHST